MAAWQDVSSPYQGRRTLRDACASIFLLLLLGLTPAAALADISLPAGGSIHLNGGAIGNAGDVSIGGQFDIGGGQLDGVGNLLVSAGGSLMGGSGLIELSGDWQMDGVFNPGTGIVRFMDGLLGSSRIAGSNSFSTLSLLSSTGKHIVVDPGGIQTILAHLEIAGTAANPLQIERLPSGLEGQFNLLAGGTQSIMHVGVSNVHANGEPLAPTQSNEGGAGNDTGWFGTVALAAIVGPKLVPALSQSLLLLLSVLMLGAALTAFRPFASRQVGGTW